MSAQPHGRLVLAFVFVVIAVAGASVFYAANRDQRLHDAELRSCEIAKADRVDAARAFTQTTKTSAARANDRRLSTVERELAGRESRVFAETGNQLRSRILQCRPLIEDGTRKIDERLLREAQGDL